MQGNNGAKIRASIAATILAAQLPITACTICSTDNSRQVRSQIFESNFAKTLAATAAPFPIVIALALGLSSHLGKRPKRT